MTNKSKSFFRLFFIVSIISLCLLNVGCTQWVKSKWPASKTKRIGIIEEQVFLLSDKVENLDAQNAELLKTLNESQRNDKAIEPPLDEYDRLKNKLTTLENAQESHLNENSRLNDELSATRNQLQEIRQQLTSVESDKAVIKAQLTKLETDYEKLSNEESQSRNTAAKVENEGGEESRKSLIKKTQKKLEASLIEDLLDKAISLYRQGKFKEAIARWEEVITLNPDIHEAKFNIEIAQDRIKEIEIQEGLKSNLIQRQ
ncbi:MAG: hypothetical protein GY941_07640 [Planctomycetes bacterium]|nr:hypothetical protein [Planctomycetota bacterium]